MILSLGTIWIAAALSVVLLGGLALRLIFAPENAQGRARSARIKALGNDGRSEAAAALVKAGAQGTIGRDLPLIGNVTLLLHRAGLEGRGLIVSLMMISGAILFGTALCIPVHPSLAFPVAIVCSAIGTLNILKARHQKRVTVLVQQLPDALDLMMRGLRVGHPVNATIANVGRTMADPIGAEFRTMNQQIAHGDFLVDAFKDFSERVGQEDVEYLSVAVSIQHGTGGNLAKMLGTLSSVVRERIVMRRRIMAISSEGRLSAMLLSALPVVIYLATSFTAPDYYAGVSDDPLFKPLAWAIVLLVIGNFLALRKLVAFKF
ncbi:MAG: type II secretion system F family protein [Sulfitobacter sp.]